MPEYRGAVLIIGSLWWDVENKTRANWQEHRLDISKAEKAFAPIRYGKLSDTRNKTYTMVFSLSCHGDMMGKALLVPFQKSVLILDDLIIEAQKLWEAEGGKSDRVSGTWGSVGLLVNPTAKLPDELVNGWKDVYQRQNNKPTFESIEGEQPPLSNEGMLLLDWIKDVDNQPVNFDFILATATDPQSRTYPTAKEIAQASLDNHYSEYFDNNREHGITTFQDEEILKFLQTKE